MAAISDSGRNLSYPWSHVLRGGGGGGGGNELEAAAAVTPAFPSAAVLPEPASPRRSPPSPESVQIFDGGDASANSKKPVWNKQSNGVIEVSPLMGTSWPALSESARASPKSSSDSLKALGDGSLASPASVTQGAAIPSSPKKQNSNNNTNPNSSHNHVGPTRQKSMRSRCGHASNGGLQPLPSAETAQNTSDKPALAGVDSSPRDVSQKNSNRETLSTGAFGSQQSQVGNDQPRSSSRRGNGNGPHHGNSSRRDQDRQNFEWNPHQNFSGRDIHVRQPRAAGRRNFARPQPPSPPPFITPPVHHYAGPIGFPDLHSPPVYYVPAPPPESLTGVVPFVAGPPGMFIPATDPHLRTMLVKQIDYYFSQENLCKDIYLRQNMDEKGWVPISLIASFNRVKQLTMHIPIILEAVRSSTVIEVQGDKIRKRNDWMNWLLPLPSMFGTVVTRPQSPNYDTLAAQMQSIGLESAANHTSTRPAESHPERVLTRSSSEGAPSSQLQGTMPTGVPYGVEMGPNNTQRGSNWSSAVRRLEKNGLC